MRVGRNPIAPTGRIARTRPSGRDQVSLPALALEWDLTDKTDRDTVLNIVRQVITGDGGGGEPASHIIALLMPFEFSVTGSPVTNNGVLQVDWGDQAANEILAGPTFGSPDTPGFRAMVNNDLPYRSRIHIEDTAMGATVTPDAGISSQFALVADQNFTLNPPSNPLDGQKVTIRITQDGTGGRLMTYHADYRFSTYLTPAFCTLTTTPGATDYLGIERNDDADCWDIIAFVPGCI